VWEKGNHKAAAIFGVDASGIMSDVKALVTSVLFNQLACGQGAAEGKEWIRTMN
jgi:hypothetical protein